MLRACSRESRVAVRSGHKVGKSTTAAALALWFWLMHPGARVVLTAPTFRQVKSILWREIRRLYGGARWPLGGVLHADPDAGLQCQDGREIVGFSTTEPERMAGISGANVLFIVDEASGVPEEIFEAIEGNRAGGARLVMFSNPTRTSGTFFDAFNAKREFWTTMHISSTETPNAQGVGNIPGLATKAWIDEKIREWGESSPLYAVRIQGDFPSQSENAIIGLAVVQSALDRWEDAPAVGELVLGVDVARFGDDESVIQPVRGHKAYRPTAVHGLDTVAVAGKVLEVARTMRTRGEPVTVNVDVIGVGAGVADNLRQHDWLSVNDVNVAVAAKNENDFVNLRAELWFGMRDWLKVGGISEDSKLESELVAPTYSFDNRGRYKVESKDELKKRLARSPDRADALALALYKARQYENQFLSY